MTNPHLQLAQYLTAQLAQLKAVQAIGLGGSLMSGQAGAASDVDLYVFTAEIPPVEERRRIAAVRGFSKADFNLQYWDTGDEWFDAPSGIEVDVMFWHPDWIEAQLAKVLERHESSTGYTTCFWHTIRQMEILHDPGRWLAGLKAKAQMAYPAELRENIIRKNYPLLHQIIPAYTHQLEKAVRRGDLVSIQHRLTEYLASYFDILFAINQIPHPGEKRLIPFALGHCLLLPENFAEDLQALIFPEKPPDESWLRRLSHLNQAMDTLLEKAGFHL